MPRIRTEIHVTVTTYVGDDVGEDTPALVRSADAFETVALVRVQAVQAGAHDVAAEQIATMLQGVTPVLAERIRHTLRNL